jgi:16S rRNA G966 N2-methylase RsmD
MLFDMKGIVHKKFVLSGQTVNSAYYCDVLRDSVKMCKTSPRALATKVQTVASRQCIVSHFFTRESLTKNNMTVFSHPPYSHDLAPCHFSVSRHFDTTEVIQAESQVALHTLIEHDFQDAFQKWQQHWERSIRAYGVYFESDGDQ